jgi:hypothetical protein
MQFVIIGKAKAASTTKHRVSRRAKWNWPADLRVIGECWIPNNDPTLIAILETEDVGAVVRAATDWEDVFDLTVLPAMTAERVLQLAKHHGLPPPPR